MQRNAILLLTLMLLGLRALTGAAPDAVRAETFVLYDGALGGTPDAQGFTYLTLPLVGAAARQSFADGATTLDTTAVQAESAGYFAQNMPVLDRNLGYTVRFTVAVEEEAHASPHRAGFSVIVLGQDLLGIELGFWEDEIWAQEGGREALFTHAEGAAFDATAGLIAYELTISGAQYALAADGEPLLAGALRDYTAFEGTFDPYETPNFFFLGDNTASARARIRLSYAAVTATAAVPPTPTPTPSPTPGATPPPAAQRYLPIVRR